MVLNVKLIHIVIERFVLDKRNVAGIHRFLIVMQYEVRVQERYTFFACLFSRKTSEFKFVHLRIHLKTSFALEKLGHENLYILSVLISLITRIKNLVMNQLVSLNDSMT